MAGRAKSRSKTSSHSDGGFSWVRFWWVGPILIAAVVGAWLTGGPGSSRPRAAAPAKALPGYIASLATVASEYTRFQGKVFQMPDVEQKFQQANERVAVQDYAGAVALLEDASKQAPVPVIFNDLGVLYAELNDRSRAINAFREALARDLDYQPVRYNLERLKGFTSQDAEPVTHEIEPNDSAALANLMAVGKPVDAEISAGKNDVDYFRITTPPAPRDLFIIEIQARSKTLAPVLRVYDVDQRLLDFGKELRQPGVSLTQSLSPEPNTAFFLAISGYGGSAGEYTLLMRQLKAFDVYEPNDDVYSARTITVGSSIDANIMDPSDTDYYAFAAPRTGMVTINVHNRSATLIPALSTFNPDKSSSGFGPDVRTPGANLKHVMEVQEGQTYYIQVWSQSRTAGDYSLTVQ